MLLSDFKSRNYTYTSKVKNQAQYKKFTIKMEIPRGGVIESLLYVVYTTDLPTADSKNRGYYY